MSMFLSIFKMRILFVLFVGFVVVGIYIVAIVFLCCQCSLYILDFS
jgi:hypothetical protein